MRRVSTVTYLTLGLVALTMGLFSAAHAFGLLPDTLTQRFRQRAQLCETLTLALASSAQSGDYRQADELIRAVLHREAELYSVGLTNPAGLYTYASNDHLVQWNASPEDDSRATHMRVPVSRDNQEWGTAEFLFKPLVPQTGWVLLHSPMIQLMALIALGGFVAYRVYLRRMLTYLDPSQAVPQRVRAAFDTLSEGVAILDNKERLVLVNAAGCRVLDAEEKKLLGRKLSSFPWKIPATADKKLAMPWLRVLSDNEPQRGCELRASDRFGDHAYSVNASPILGHKDKAEGVLVTFDDVTNVERKNHDLADLVKQLELSRDQIRRKNEELQLLATRDPLTGCLNRRAFRERLEAEWKRTKRHGAPLSCIMLDIDHFKSVNDTHGHAAGDVVLQGVAKTLRDESRGTDLICRFGGEEFCILVPETRFDDAAVFAEKLRASIEAARFGKLRVTSSFGVATHLHDLTAPEEMLEFADQALYAAKESGRNRVVRSDQLPTLAEHAKATAVTSREPNECIPLTALNGLLEALAQRDPATAAHSRRVSDLAVMLGAEFLDAQECFLLEVAALLHDIGKIGVPDAVLLKPGPLSPEERLVMDQHERIGIEIINSAFRSTELTNIVQAHHAHFAGCPRHPGLPTGAEIPLRARILAIADAFDAMVSDRPYRRAMSPDAAIAELRRCAGSQFDPSLVERFVEILAARGGSDKLHPLPEPLETAFRLGVQAERIAALLDGNDLEQMRTVAERLVTVAENTSLKPIRDRAFALQQQLEKSFDEDALAAMRELLDQCQTLQHEMMTSARSDAALSVPPQTLPN